MRLIQLLTAVLWIAGSLSPTSAQIHWKEVKSVEDFYQAYPERLKFMFDQINLDRIGLELVKKHHAQQNYVAASTALLDYYRKVDLFRDTESLSQQGAVEKMLLQIPF